MTNTTRPDFQIFFLFSFFFVLCSFPIRAQKLTLTEQGYLHTPSLSVLAFHNRYPVGMQGGIEIIHHDNRIATNGNVDYRLKTNEAQGYGVDTLHVPVPRIEVPERQTDQATGVIRIPFDYEKLDLKYHIQIIPLADYAFRVDVNFESPVNAGRFEEIFFDMDFYPEAYAGKSFISESGYGRFPFDFSGNVDDRYGDIPVEPLVSGKKLVLAPEDPLLRMEINSAGKELTLLDNRWGEQRMWFRLRAPADLSKQDQAISLTFRPHIRPDWSRPPVIAVSQAGYHPDQPKRAIIELPQQTENVAEAALYRLETNGEFRLMESESPQLWGDFLRYTYAVYVFSHVKKDGFYRIAYGDQVSQIFAISEDVYKEGVWQPVLETFMPVQMCHMSVRDRGRLWHGACHLDDAVQVPAPMPYFDGFRQSDTTDTQFEPKTTIPGLNVGGWHDAGDDDVNTGSNGRTIYYLVLAMEEFGMSSDQTTVDFERREVHLHKPDGISDAAQQVMHGVQWLLAQYRQLDHSIVGVISSSWQTYLQTSDWSVFTDNLFYDPEMKEDEKSGTHSGRFDDRYAFTNKDTRREYMVAAILAASSRVLSEYDPALSAECLDVARRIWTFEESNEPVFFPSVGTPRNLTAQRANAAVELFLTTGEQEYLEALVSDREKVLEEVDDTGWTISRVIDRINDQEFKSDYTSALEKYSSEFAGHLAENPFGIRTSFQVWGIGWDILWHMQGHYFLIKKYPQLFPREQLYNAVHYQLGVHPGSNLSLVSSVGSHRPIPAFGINRSDYSYIPGGVYSGTGLIRPDFPELKDDHPYLWQQSEYIISGATPYIFCVLAADALLNE